MNKESTQFAALQEKFAGLGTPQRVLVFALTFLAIGAVFYFFSYKDLRQRSQKLEASIADQEKRLTSLKQAAAQVEALQKEITQAEEEFQHFLSLLPDQKELPALLESVSQLGAQVGLENILFQPQAEQPREFYAAIPVRLDLIGTYHQLGIFFDRVSKLDRILKVESLSLTRQKNSPRLQVGCTVVTYRFVEKPPQPEKAGKK